MGAREAKDLEKAIVNMVANGEKVESDGTHIFIRSGSYGARIVARNSDLNPRCRGTSLSYDHDTIEKYVKR